MFWLIKSALILTNVFSILSKNFFIHARWQYVLWRMDELFIKIKCFVTDRESEITASDCSLIMTQRFKVSKVNCENIWTCIHPFDCWSDHKISCFHLRAIVCLNFDIDIVSKKNYTRKFDIEHRHFLWKKITHERFWFYVVCIEIDYFWNSFVRLLKF